MTISLHDIIQLDDLIFEELRDKMELFLIKRKQDRERNKHKWNDRKEKPWEKDGVTEGKWLNRNELTLAIITNTMGRINEDMSKEKTF